MKTNETYNGWTNYATWRVHLELFDGLETDGVEHNAESIEELAHEIIGLNDSRHDSFEAIESYAAAFLSGVNWHEIAEHINEYNNQ